MRIDLPLLHGYAALAGDLNPLHIDPVYARKTAFGTCLINATLQCQLLLEALAERCACPLEISLLQAQFPAALHVDEDFELILPPPKRQADTRSRAHTRKEEDALTWELQVRRLSGDVTCKLKVILATAPSAPRHPRKKHDDEAQILPGTLPPCSSILEQAPYPPDPAPGKSQLWQDRLDYNRELCAALFPSTALFLEPRCVAALLLCSRSPGMHYPGLRALTADFKLIFPPKRETATGPGTAPSATPCKVQIKGQLEDERFMLAALTLSSADVTGQLHSFFRPPYPQPDTISTLLDSDCQIPGALGQRALVIGGSRGLGAQCVRYLALNGAEVWFTYHSCRDDAQLLLEDLKAVTLSSRCCAFDVLLPDPGTVQRLASFAPTHLYFFATPPLETSGAAALSATLLQRLTQCYVGALDRLIITLPTLRAVFAPSSNILDDPRPRRALREYAIAKAALEEYARQLGSKQLRVSTPRFPRTATALTLSQLPQQLPSPQSVIFPALKDFLSFEPEAPLTVQK